MKVPAALLLCLLAGCATTADKVTPPDWVATECSSEAFRGLRDEISRSNKALRAAAQAANRNPTEDNEAKAAAAAADVAIAHADVDARRADCSSWRVGL